jgi:hypothetical protein
MFTLAVFLVVAAIVAVANPLVEVGLFVVLMVLGLVGIRNTARRLGFGFEPAHCDHWGP